MDTIGQLLRIASKYDISSLKQELSCHIKSTLSLSNALEFFKYASENGLCLKDIQLIRAYILKKNFMALNQQSNGFSNISQQDLESFIMDDNLGLKEEELFNLINGWVKNGYPGRASLLNHVRYQNMNDIIDIKSDILKFADGTSLMESGSDPAETAAQRFGKDCVIDKQMEGYI